jgi:hypothetical protein
MRRVCQKLKAKLLYQSVGRGLQARKVKKVDPNGAVTE